MPAYAAVTNAPQATVTPTNDTYDVTFAAEPTGRTPAARFGVRVHSANGEVIPFYYDAETRTVNMAGLEHFFDPMPVYAACMPTKHPEKRSGRPISTRTPT